MEVCDHTSRARVTERFSAGWNGKALKHENEIELAAGESVFS